MTVSCAAGRRVRSTAASLVVTKCSVAPVSAFSVMWWGVVGGEKGLFVHLSVLLSLNEDAEQLYVLCCCFSFSSASPIP